MIDSIKIEEVQPDGTKVEINKDPSSGYHNFLVMFNSIVDLDFSILRMIQAEYNNPKYVETSHQKDIFIEEVRKFQKGGSYRKTHPIIREDD